MKTLVILSGVAGCGKTDTLNRLIGKLQQEPDLQTLTHLYTPNGKDQLFIATTSSGTVAVVTAGDYEEIEFIDQALMECKNAKIIFAAGRTRGAVNDLLCNFASKHEYNVIITSPMLTFSKNKELQEALNQHDASLLYELLPLL